MRAVLSIGSNMDDRYALLRSAYEEFLPDLVGASSIYATPPWGVEDQDEFLNAVLIVDVDETPMELLKRGQALEQAAERKRIRHWGPRTLDVDIVCIEGVTSDDPELTLPHPYAHERNFVLVPWLEADPHATLNGRPLSELITGTFPIVGTL
ncbi:2-amino-4-hydroxy-6-hydroxymethyldihydropteridine pyrophosphokinase [Corynebacterium ulcerans]|uniref:2-amino-4-hydroxy-6- hydroxymethyldihydropteridine diphosphokinase n=1 Tax=Corynebacterium ulcerans TaxID=65058 RepID=UPI0005210D9F|nr:2-amino-4-hydroxy-6-hydroxymethyldihydropteridine diphosphokinase [Corynebacterium ulcerans]AIU31248.1 2-amino-4-hydroxy-6-hydroxymethyldihydropteridine pyrophosphokinase [Corynebacterium ulcerans]AIU92518.1 2-amino-4-hydroxy-6-hydroxymethyldihydropteridine pyrophosphokinase [Corynebacterium ulcerans]MBH5302212.1 2-amino-4-hydroxy-6-hydroxymethyldihydropteridine diphosphokinase [Corynebacterium ulcerans]NOL62754.1 2-amino-4-hydroxy-6-hydroxymethyldihydropteridine diphosphokinase [Corynebacte